MSECHASGYSLSGIPLKTSPDEVDHEEVLPLPEEGGEDQAEVPGAWRPPGRA